MRPPVIPCIIFAIVLSAQAQSEISSNPPLLESASSSQQSLSTRSATRTFATRSFKTSHSTQTINGPSTIEAPTGIAGSTDGFAASPSSPARNVIAGAVAGSVVFLTLIVAFVSYRYGCRPRRPFRSLSNTSMPAKPALDHEQGRALEEEVEVLRRKVARLEAERIAIGFDAAPTPGNASVYVGEKDEIAVRAYTAGLATMGELKGDLVHTRRDTMGPPPPKYEG